MFKKIIAWIKAIRAQNRTLYDLSRLDHRALGDIGISQGDIPVVARRIREDVYQAELMR